MVWEGRHRKVSLPPYPANLSNSNLQGTNLQKNAETPAPCPADRHEQEACGL